MKIGFDISQTVYRGGVATYTKNLSKYLSQISGLEMKYFYSSFKTPLSYDLKNVKTFPIPASLNEFLFNQLRIVPIETLVGKVDIFHSSDWTQPPSKALKVTTYHDLVPLKYPEWSDPKIVAVHKRRLKE